MSDTHGDEIERLRLESALYKDQMEGCRFQWKRARADADAAWDRVNELENELIMMRGREAGYSS